MKLKGLQLHGLRLWVTGDVPAAICNHRHNAAATMTIDTDTTPNNSIWMSEYLAAKNNLRMGVFGSPFETIIVVDPRAAELTGILHWDVYFQTDRWRSPTVVPDSPITMACPVIPDYYAAAWTADGVAAFSGATLGVAKSTRTPNHGQEMYDISGGTYGYDVGGGVPGATDVLTGLIAAHRDWFWTTFHRLPQALSYRNGQVGAAYGLTAFLAGRNSSASTSGDSNTAYGTEWDGAGDLGLPALTTITHVYALNRASSTRWLELGGDAAATAYCVAEITKTLANGGWWNNFTHFHDLDTTTEKENWRTFLAAIGTALGSSLVHWCGYGEAMSYQMLRAAATRVSAYVDSTDVVLQIQLDKEYATLDGALFQTPISVSIDLTGTALTGNDLAAGANVAYVAKTGTDTFIADVDCSRRADGLVLARLTTTVAPAYVTYTAPTISSVDYDSGVVTVITVEPTRIALFYTTRGAEDYTVELICRSNTLGTRHTVDLNIDAVRDAQRVYTLAEIVAGDVYIAATTETGKSATTGPEQWA